MCGNFQREVQPCRGTFEWLSSTNHGILQFDWKLDYLVERKDRYFHTLTANSEPEIYVGKEELRDDGVKKDERGQHRVNVRGNQYPIFVQLSSHVLTQVSDSAMQRPVSWIFRDGTFPWGLTLRYSSDRNPPRSAGEAIETSDSSSCFLLTIIRHRA